ncbi:rhomboid-like protein [Nocardia macrotermitis]|uniref:Uncharacterized protein n=1 Tax=Nocardia macrotermitis TaxID=2585198 RepID=A0A7K0DDJ8_9NOCA|nr:rhomboid-like protein [Nocardia macrotermitis]MQY23738.1 hypothetical protein [Nocardia macrotermitis]
MVVLAAPNQETTTPTVSVTTSRFRWRRLFLPATYGYAALLILVTVLVSVLSNSAQTRVMLHASTNLYNLLNGHLGTLFSSALLIGDTDTSLLVLPLLICLLALAELKFGASRLIRIFLAGHLGSTLLVALGLWVAVEAHWLPLAITHAEDVGISYGSMALIGAFLVLMPSRWRPTWAITWLAVAVAGVAMGRSFTNVGHLISVSIGLLVGLWLIRRGRTVPHGFKKVEIVLLVIATLLGYTILVG